MVLLSHRVERLAFALLLILVVWLPLPLGSNRPWAWSLMELLIAIQTILILWCCREAIPWRWLKPLRWLLAGVALFQVFTLLQLLSLPIEWLAKVSPGAASLWQSTADVRIVHESASVSVDPQQTHVALLKGISYLLLMFNCGVLIHSPERIRAVMTAFVVSGTFQAFYGAMLVLSGVSLSPVFAMVIGDIATGSFVYKNHFANYLLLCICMGLGLVVADLNLLGAHSWRHRMRRLVEALLSAKMLVRLCMVIMVIGLVMSRSRMGNSALFITTLLGAVLALLLYKHRPRSLTILFASLLIIDVLVVSSLFGLSKLRERLEATVLVEEGRVDVLNWSWPLVQDFWLTGSGAGSFYALFQNYAPEPMTHFYDHAHNDYLQFVIESGVVASAVLALVVLLVLGRCLVTMYTRKDPLMKATTLACAMAIIAMLIHISVDFNLQAPANAASFVIILSLGAIAARMPRQGYVSE
ncbi:O-antigen ligase family protein [Aliagarivorans taiwanensis]|uniref:O-antigen ligase family protein n=1 Tax=Aliagarivorans taiwanensis TaxID=561966 RepID=UPI0004024C76|nr:O-antigen ligase family protein [Aliagarivorans taiwanensis]